MPIRDDSAGSYGTWNNDDLGWLDYIKANASDGGNALANLGRNLVDGFSPIGKSEQGNMALQVPPIVSGIAQSYGRLAGTPNNPGNAYSLTGVPELDAPVQQDMSNVLLSLYGGNALNPLAKAPAGSVGMFAGRGAKTADHAALARAEEMAGQGIPREQIWNDTGWFKGADDKWRFEIDDSGQKLLKTREELARLGRPIASDQVFAHDKLYAAYPELADTPWYLTPSIENGGASFDKVRGIRVGDGEGFSYGKSGMGGMTLHEQQHGIQDIEGFARGGSREFGNKLDDVQREARNAYELSRTRQASGVRTPEDEIAAELGIAEPVLIKPWDDLSQREQLGWYEAGRGRAYNRLAGETEARTVQSRMNLTPEERQARPPWLDYDVPEAEQIVRLLSDTGKPSILGSAMAGAGEKPLSIKAYRGFSGDSPIGGNDLLYSTKSPQLASEYAMQWADETGNPPAVYPIDITFKNPMQIDAQGEPWLSVPFEGRELTARGIAEIAKKRGHDGVHFSNMLDSSEHRVNYDPQDIYVAVQPNTVRSAITGETLFSDNRPSLFGSALATGGEDLPPWLQF